MSIKKTWEKSFSFSNTSLHQLCQRIMSNFHQSLFKLLIVFLEDVVELWCYWIIILILILLILLLMSILITTAIIIIVIIMMHWKPSWCPSLWVRTTISDIWVLCFSCSVFLRTVCKSYWGSSLNPWEEKLSFLVLKQPLWLMQGLT